MKTKNRISTLLGLALILAFFPLTTPYVSAENTGHAWPSLADAEIRPGVQVYSNGGQCTSNFVFRDVVTNDLHLGLAAHCVGQVGQQATIHGPNGNAVAIGTVSYTSWAHTNGHDFALIKVPDEATSKVHPAALHYGGPSGLSDTSQLVGGERILFYGNSGLRFGLDPSNWHEGYVTLPGAEGGYGHFITPGIPGDSGSAVIDANGRALGVLVTVGVAFSLESGLIAGTNGFTNLDTALELAEERTGLQLELQTWDLLEGGHLPDLPL